LFLLVVGVGYVGVGELCTSCFFDSESEMFEGCGPESQKVRKVRKCWAVLVKLPF